MVGGGECAVWSPDLAAGILQTLKRLLSGQLVFILANFLVCRSSMGRDTHRRGDFMDEMSVNVQQNCAIQLLVDNMGLEDLVIQSLGGAVGHGHLVRLFDLVFSGCVTGVPVSLSVCVCDLCIGDLRCEFYVRPFAPVLGSGY